MKQKLIILLAICTFGINVSHAQEMKKGMSLFNVGLGFIDGWGLNASFDYALVSSWGPGIFTVGGYVGFDNWSYNSDIRATEFGFAPRVTYRYSINKSFEVYATAMLGARIKTYSKENDNVNDVFFGSTVGCRYTFTRNISVFAEAGYSISYLNGGLSFSF